jgi:hypothetical protein
LIFNKEMATKAGKKATIYNDPLTRLHRRDQHAAVHRVAAKMTNCCPPSYRKRRSSSLLVARLRWPGPRCRRPDSAAAAVSFTACS